MSRPPAPTRADFRSFHTITTRWADNDVFGHVNNVVYHAWVDTAVNRFLIAHNLLDLRTSEIIGVVAENSCRYFREITYPDDVTLGIRVAKLGRSSVQYRIGIFRNTEDTAAAEAHFVHVYVERATMRPVPIPEAARAAMQTIMIPEEN